MSIDASIERNIRSQQRRHNHEVQHMSTFANAPSQHASLFQKLAHRRSWTPQYLSEINTATTDQLKDIDTLAAALHRLRQTQELIVVMPDFDMDGVTSGVLGWAGLNELGLNAELYIPDHRNGHDITPAAVADLYSKHPGAAAVITCDAGINSNDGIRQGQALGMAMYVTDHHEELQPGSVADIAVNPMRMDETYEHTGISGAMVLYLVLEYYAKTYAPEKLAAIERLQLFAGIGTVADVMPVLYRNRQVIRNSVGIARNLYHDMDPANLADPYSIETTTEMTIVRANDHAPQYISAIEGFALLLGQLREAGNLKSIFDITEEFYGFTLAPMFNSVRRVDGDMHHAFGVFTAGDEATKKEHIAKLIEYNEFRKESVEQYMQQLLTAEQPYEPHLYLTDAPSGMLGLIASKLMSETNQPVVVLNAEDRKGSARAPIWYGVITQLAQHNITAIGHQQACGVLLHDDQTFEQLAEALNTSAQQAYDEAEKAGVIDQLNTAELRIGYSLRDQRNDGTYQDLDELLELATIIEHHRPFGQAFRKPVIEFPIDLSTCAIKGLWSSKDNRKETDPKHISISTHSGLKLMWWNSYEQYFQDLQRRKARLGRSAVIVVQAELNLNRFMGEIVPQAIIQNIVDYQPLDQQFHDHDVFDFDWRSEA